MYTTIEEIKKASNKYSQIREKIRRAIITINPVELVTPLGATAEEMDWLDTLEKSNYRVFENPNLDNYDPALINHCISQEKALLQLQSELSSVKENATGIAESFVLENYMQAITDSLKTAKLAKSIENKNDKESASIVKEKYGCPSFDNVTDAINIAHQILNGSFDVSAAKKANISFKPKTLRWFNTIKPIYTQDFMSMIKSAFDLYQTHASPIYQIPDYVYGTVEALDKTFFKTAPSVIVPLVANMDDFSFVRLLKREIDCRWRCSRNVEELGLLKCDDEFVYDGFSAFTDMDYSEKYLGQKAIDGIYYMVAIDNASCSDDGQGSFTNTAKLIYNLLPETMDKKTRARNTWKYTYSAYRGITDTNNKSGYAFTKDRNIYEGYVYVKSLFLHESTEYLNYGALPKTIFEKFMSIVDKKDAERNAILSQDIEPFLFNEIEKAIPIVHPI